MFLLSVWRRNSLIADITCYFIIAPIIPPDIPIVEEDSSHSALMPFLDQGGRIKVWQRTQKVI